MFLRSGDARMHRIVRLKIVRFLPTRDSPSLTRTLPTSSCPYVARIPTLFPILFPDIDIFSSLSLSRENCHLIAACQTNLYLNLATYNFLLTNQESHRKRNLDPISAIIRNTWTKKKTLDSLSLSRLFLFLSLPFPKHSGKSEEKDIEKESNAFSRRAWRIPNSDWQLINTASRHSRGQLARPRYRNAIFIARVRARAPPHTHTLSFDTHETATSKLPAISRKSISPVACNFIRRDFSLNAPSLSSSYILDQRRLRRATLKLHHLVHDRYRHLPGSQSVDACSLMGGMQDSSPILRERKRGELSAQPKIEFSSTDIVQLLLLLFSFLRGYFSDFSSPLLLWISVRYAARGDDDEVRRRRATEARRLNRFPRRGRGGEGGGGFGSRGIGFPRGDPFSRRGSFAATGKAKLEGDKATGRTFGRRHDWACIFLHPSCNGGTNFPGLRTGREARLRGRNSMEDLEECSSFKGWG